MVCMSAVLHLHHALTERPAEADCPTVGLRTYQGPSDIDHWLEIRERAFARERVGVSRWTHADFEREFLAKPWWKPEHLWFAVPVETAAAGKIVGTVTLARRGIGATSRPVIHWLAVLPVWRRQGVGRLLVRTLEIACWDSGEREILLETHAAWARAASLYSAMAYYPVASSGSQS